MSVKIHTVLSSDEFHKKNEAAKAAGLYDSDRTIFPPGTIWYMDWYFDPTGERVRSNQHVMYKEIPADIHNSYLSPHYWRDWAKIRPPICIVCPNDTLWIPDCRSSNGDGWKVESEDLFNITCSPSIVQKGYHGFLRNGQFTGDLEGRGPNGISPYKKEGLSDLSQLTLDKRIKL